VQHDNLWPEFTLSFRKLIWENLYEDSHVVCRKGPNHRRTGQFFLAGWAIFARKNISTAPEKKLLI